MRETRGWAGNPAVKAAGNPGVKETETLWSGTSKVAVSDPEERKP